MVNPAAQLVTQRPLLQLVPDAFGSNVVQTLPHPPQLRGSEARFAQALLQQLGAPVPHAAPHAPQLVGSLVRSTHVPGPQQDSWPLSQESPTLTQTPLELQICGC
jgi:hypothetical protein